MFTTLAILALAACNTPGDRRGGMITPPTDAGSSSGIAPSRALTSLSPTEVRTVCTYVSAQVGTGTTECGDGITVNGTTVDGCVEDFGSPPAGCTATVGDVESCSELLGDDPCIIVSGSLPPVCSFLASCATTSG
jgi:hypothetical protein